METGFQLPEDLRMLQTWMRNFIRREIVPLERSLDPEAVDLPEEDYQSLARVARDAGMWCLGVPEEWGGGGLGCFQMTESQVLKLLSGYHLRR